MIKKLLVPFFIFAYFHGNAGTLKFEWAKKAGAAASESGYSTCFDPAGNMYVTGATSSGGFSGITAGAFQTSFGGVSDAFLMKYDPTGSLIWGTYLGGGAADKANAITFDVATGNVYIAGATSSGNFPITGNAFQTALGLSPGPNDAFIAQFNASTGGLNWSTYYGGNYDEYITSLTIDGNNKLLATGSSSSPNFPTTSGAYKTAGSTYYTAFILRFLSSGNRDVATLYYGNNLPMGHTYSNAINRDGNGKVYIAGESYDYMIYGIASGGYIQTTLGAASDGFIATFSPALTSVSWATFFGANGVDKINSIVSSGSNLCVVGNTQSSVGLPTFNPGGGAYYQSTLSGPQDAFISAFNLSTTALVWSTYYGGITTETVTACSVDANGILYVSGGTQSPNFPVMNPGTGGFYQSILGGGSDAFMLNFDNSFVRRWGTYLGGSATDIANSISVQPGNPTNIFVTGSFQGSVGFGPNTTLVSGGSDDVFSAKLNECSSFNFLATASPTTICSGNSSTLSAGGATTFNWTPATFLSTTSGPVTFCIPSAPGIFNYSVTGTYGSCVNQQMLAVNVLGNPTVLVSSNNSICGGQTIILSSSGAIVYDWMPTTGLSSATGPMVQASPLTSQNYSVTGTGGNGCKNTATVYVGIWPTPTFNVDVSNPSVCLGNSSDFTTYNQIGNMPFTYGWTPTIFLNAATGGIVSATPNMVGTYNYTVTGTDVNNCQSSLAVPLTVLPDPTVIVSGNLTTCSGVLTTFSASGASSYLWSSGTIPSTGNIVSVTSTTSSTYSVTGTNAFGCMNVTSVNTSVLPLPPISVLASNNNVCLGNSTTMSASGAVNYSWQPAAGLSSANAAIVDASPITTTDYSVTGINVNGCQNSVSKTIIVNIPDIIGHVTSNGSNVAGNPNTFALLYKYAVNKEMQQMDSVGLDATGNYTFINLSTQDTLIVFVQADPTLYPNTAGTYYSNAFEWGNATKIYPSCPSTSSDITLVQMQGGTGGTGSISGQVVEGQGFHKKEAAGDGIEGVQVGLKKKPGGQIAANTNTDSNGDYDFNDVPDGDYTIVVEIPGLPVVSSYSISITSSSQTYDNANFQADSNKIEAISGDFVKEFSRNLEFSVFPNPANEEFYVAFSTEENRSIQVLNPLGQLVYSISSSNKMTKINVSELPAGIYFVQVTGADRNSANRLISITR